MGKQKRDSKGRFAGGGGGGGGGGALSGAVVKRATRGQKFASGVKKSARVVKKIHDHPATEVIAPFVGTIAFAYLAAGASPTKTLAKHKAYNARWASQSRGISGDRATNAVKAKRSMRGTQKVHSMGHGDRVMAARSRT